MLGEGHVVSGGKYRLQECLGRGAQGEVWAAQQTGLGHFAKDVVLKFVLVKGAMRQKIQDMLLQEARLCAGLSHPTIVSVLDVGEDDGRVFIAMERIHGMDLAQLQLRYASLEQGPLPWPLVCYMVQRVCRGLHYAHTKKRDDGRSLALVHRDIKPHNILLSEIGALKIIDFGIARAYQSIRKTQTDHIKGTPAYMSPEQIAVRPVDARSDLFSLGVLLYELCSGVLPFDAPKMFSVLYRILEDDPTPLRELVPDIPRELEDVVMRLLAKTPGDRFASAKALQQALAEVMSGGGHIVDEDDLAALYASVRDLPLSNEPTESTTSSIDEVERIVLPTPSELKHRVDDAVSTDDASERDTEDEARPRWMQHTMPLPDDDIFDDTDEEERIVPGLPSAEFSEGVLRDGIDALEQEDEGPVPESAAPLGSELQVVADVAEGPFGATPPVEGVPRGSESAPGRWRGWWIPLLIGLALSGGWWMGRMGSPSRQGAPAVRRGGSERRVLPRASRSRPKPRRMVQRAPLLKSRPRRMEVPRRVSSVNPRRTPVRRSTVGRKRWRGLPLLVLSLRPKVELFEEKGRKRVRLGQGVSSIRLRRPVGRHCFFVYARAYRIARSFCAVVKTRRLHRVKHHISFGWVKLTLSQGGLVFLKGFGQIGKTGKRIRLPVGKHRLKVLASGALVPSTIAVVVRVGKTTEISRLP